MPYRNGIVIKPAGPSGGSVEAAPTGSARLIPSPWLIFFCSILAGPIVAIATSMVTAANQSTRVEERLTTVIARQAESDARAVARLREVDTRMDRQDAQVRLVETGVIQAATRIESIIRDQEALDRRGTERFVAIQDNLRRLQNQIQNLAMRPNGQRNNYSNPQSEDDEEIVLHFRPALILPMDSDYYYQANSTYRFCGRTEPNVFSNPPNPSHSATR